MSWEHPRWVGSTRDELGATLVSWEHLWWGFSKRRHTIEDLKTVTIRIYTIHTIWLTLPRSVISHHFSLHYVPNIKCCYFTGGDANSTKLFPRWRGNRSRRWKRIGSHPWTEAGGRWSSSSPLLQTAQPMLAKVRPTHEQTHRLQSHARQYLQYVLHLQ